MVWEACVCLWGGEGRQVCVFVALFLLLGLPAMCTGHLGWNIASVSLAFSRLSNEDCNLIPPLLLHQLESDGPWEDGGGGWVCTFVALIFFPPGKDGCSTATATLCIASMPCHWAQPQCVLTTQARMLPQPLYSSPGCQVGLQPDLPLLPLEPQ